MGPPGQEFLQTILFVINQVAPEIFQKFSCIVGSEWVTRKDTSIVAQKNFVFKSPIIQ